MILVLAGTQEGRQAAKLLQNQGLRVTASAVTSYGGELLRREGVQRILIGPLDGPALENLLGQGYQLLVDATHPFAAQVSQTAMAACAMLGVPYLRLERPPVVLPDHPLIYQEADLLSSIQRAVTLGKVIFSTLGSKNLSLLLETARRVEARVVARILPDTTVLEQCFKLGLTPAEVIALQGPCSREVNAALYRQYQAQVVLTKESGDTGGELDKVWASLDVGIPIVVWQRPKMNYPKVVNTVDEVLAYSLERWPY